MSNLDQVRAPDPTSELAEDLVQIQAEWRRLEHWRADLEAECAAWRQALLDRGKTLGLGDLAERFG